MTDTRNEPEDRPPEGAGSTAAPGDQRIEALGADIEAARRRSQDAPDQGDQRFIHSGQEGPVDDTIVPPG